MSRHKHILKGLKEIMANQSSADPYKNDIKRLNAYTAEILIEVVKTLERIDKNNKKAAQIDENLGKFSNRTQIWMITLTILILITSGVSVWKLFRP